MLRYSTFANPLMGIDKSVLSHLLYGLKHGSFLNTLTLGRQQIHLTRDKVSSLVGDQVETEYGHFCEDLLINHFGSTHVDSLDYSSFEGCTFIHDLNKPLPPRLKHLASYYDTVLDLGTLEHVFNIIAALDNVSRLCKVGGRIIHVLPANGQCGHGFWQFSPDLFFGLYSVPNGYTHTEVFMADVPSGSIIKLKPPEAGDRLTVDNLGESYVMVITCKNTEYYSHEDLQQSDYAHAWKTRQ